MSKFLCWADDGSQGVEDASEYEAWDASSAALACAESEHSESAGENHYPLQVHVTYEQGPEVIFDVNCEYEPVFTATRRA